ncbi:MAG TPA: GNAT family N-acetyltransferase [Tepiditoga sp.]|nr:GNAT family N-acetyltransferase [Tepiditoga sp.]
MTDEIFLEIPGEKDENEALKMIKVWREFGGRMNPGLLRTLDKNYSEWLIYIKDKSTEKNTDEVPQTLYFMKNKSGIIFGALAIRHYLNFTNIIDGGHIAYGISPEYRGKGLGNLILNLGKEKAKNFNIEKILVTCDADNFLSQKVILKNNGVLENQTYDEDNILINRYWIDLL